MMKIANILELLIAMALIYFLFSTLVSVAFEWYSYKTQKRGRFLYQTLIDLLNDPVNQSYGATLYAHFSIDKLKKNKDSYPQYIASNMFADALIDIIGTQSESIAFEHQFVGDGSKNLRKVVLVENRTEDPFERFKKGVDKMNYSPLKSQLRAFYEKSNDYESLKKRIQEWFDDYMARVSGWYKLKTKRTLFIISLLVSLIFNIDSIALVKKINSDDDLRKNLVILAEKKAYKKDIKLMAPDSLNTNKSYSVVLRQLKESKILKDDIDKLYLQRTDSIVREIEDNSIPIGYHGFVDIRKTHGQGALWIWICGILLSSFSLSFGAPFWFEIMVKAINIRRSGIKPS